MAYIAVGVPIHRCHREQDKASAMQGRVSRINENIFSDSILTLALADPSPIEALALAEPSLTYKEHAGHHEHASTEAAEEDDLVRWDQVFASGLGKSHVSYGVASRISGSWELKIKHPSWPASGRAYVISVILLHIPLVVGNAVLAVEPAVERQCRAMSELRWDEGNDGQSVWSQQRVVAGGSEGQLEVCGWVSVEVKCQALSQPALTSFMGKKLSRSSAATLLKNFMPTALDRLLASPPALRALRALVHAHELPPTWIPAINCCQSKHRCRAYSSDLSLPKLRIRKQQWPSLEPRISLGRAKPDVDEESNVNEPGISTWRKIDKAHGFAKIGLWRELLQYRERVYGLDGIRDIWLGMARRGFDLPTSNTRDAEYLWSTFIKNPDLVIPVLDHAAHLQRSSGQSYARLYQMCMAYWLPRHPDRALKYHHLMIVKLRLRNLPLRYLTQLATTTLSAKSLEAFAEIYRTSNERNLYDDMVIPFCNQSRISLARHWHILCFQRSDTPSPSARSHPVVQLFLAESSSDYAMAADTARPMMRNGRPIYKEPIVANYRPLLTKGEAQPNSQRYNEQLLRKLLGRDIEPVRFEDPFCARLFATKAFGPASIIRGLSMIRVNEIGPIALRMMGLRTEPLSELPQRFRELKEAGIDIKPCVFSLALEKFTMEKNFHLVQSLLGSDQHPDVLEDLSLQRRLLDHYLEQMDWTQAHRTLAILTLFYNDPRGESWNLLLQARLRQGYPNQIIHILEDMRANDIFVTRESTLAIQSILRRRQPGRRPGTSSSGRFDDVRFVARNYMMILESGIGYVSPRDWKEILRRYGMLGRVREQRRLIYWLFSWYANRDNPRFADIQKSPFLDAAMAKMRQTFHHPLLYFNTPPFISQASPSHPLRQLFSPAFLQALIIWGFKAGLLPNTPLEQTMFSSVRPAKHYRKRFLKKGVLTHLHWSVGLQTVVKLRDAGLYVNPTIVVKALQQQLKLLFNRGRLNRSIGRVVQSNKLENRIIKRLNPIPYEEYVREVNRIWGKPLLREPKGNRKRLLEGMVGHPTLDGILHDDEVQDNEPGSEEFANRGDKLELPFSSDQDEPSTNGNKMGPQGNSTMIMDRIREISLAALSRKKLGRGLQPSSLGKDGSGLKGDKSSFGVVEGATLSQRTISPPYSTFAASRTPPSTTKNELEARPSTTQEGFNAHEANRQSFFSSRLDTNTQSFTKAKK
ncbi:uncharacterized protein BDR25DRAFT_394350 [Lindgomyces ingoldianus]|uniref:Uncharacterized protein n=1 Tax=Lindgomyces ingoldianus TaxID=673940 RepID=A0ACB6QQR9_9PLEO|nr:uncharacterized protein BDR25DRAFT_394350 [Lindgomyces ingoldianus]KAF2469333.1 hypothetical protein BDR25DRAFT_394350 [Lindgomyces ingoldianus]